MSAQPSALDHLAALAEKALRDDDPDLYADLQAQMARLMKRPHKRRPVSAPKDPPFLRAFDVLICSGGEVD